MSPFKGMKSDNFIIAIEGGPTIDGINVSSLRLSRFRPFELTIDFNDSPSLDIFRFFQNWEYEGRKKLTIYHNSNGTLDVLYNSSSAYVSSLLFDENPLFNGVIAGTVKIKVKSLVSYK